MIVCSEAMQLILWCQMAHQERWDLALEAHCKFVTNIWSLTNAQLTALWAIRKINKFPKNFEFSFDCTVVKGSLFTIIFTSQISLTSYFDLATSAKNKKGFKFYLFQWYLYTALQMKWELRTLASIYLLLQRQREEQAFLFWRRIKRRFHCFRTMRVHIHHCKNLLHSSENGWRQINGDHVNQDFLKSWLY